MRAGAIKKEGEDREEAAHHGHVDVVGVVGIVVCAARRFGRLGITCETRHDEDGSVTKAGRI